MDISVRNRKQAITDNIVQLFPTTREIAEEKEQVLQNVNQWFKKKRNRSPPPRQHLGGNYDIHSDNFKYRWITSGVLACFMCFCILFFVLFGESMVNQKFTRRDIENAVSIKVAVIIPPGIDINNKWKMWFDVQALMPYVYLNTVAWITDVSYIFCESKRNPVDVIIIIENDPIERLYRHMYLSEADSYTIMKEMDRDLECVQLLEKVIQHVHTNITDRQFEFSGSICRDYYCSVSSKLTNSLEKNAIEKRHHFVLWGMYSSIVTELKKHNISKFIFRLNEHNGPSDFVQALIPVNVSWKNKWSRQTWEMFGSDTLENKELYFRDIQIFKEKMQQEVPLTLLRGIAEFYNMHETLSPKINNPESLV